MGLGIYQSRGLLIVI